MRQAVRAVKVLARDGRIPRWLRWLVVAGLLPVPGPFDEVLLLVAAAILFTFYRETMRDAWLEARRPVSPRPPAPSPPPAEASPPVDWP